MMKPVKTKAKSLMAKQHYQWLIPVLLMALITPWTPALDQMIAHYFYYGNQNSPAFVSNSFTHSVYTYGLLPGQIVGILAAVGLFLSFFSQFWKKYQKETLFLTLALILGPGLLINAVLKDHWGRPRPRQVIDYGGTQTFRPYYHPNFAHQPEPSKSFPCGHCSTGYYFLALGLIGRRLNNKKLSYWGFTLGILWGSVLGIVRMAQGGHFFSDVIMSALLIWLLSLILDKFIYDDR